MSVTDVVCDASVVLKWFLEEGEPESEESRTLLDAHNTGHLVLALLELAYHEVGNSLLRRHRLTAARTVAVLDAMRALCGHPLTASRDELHEAARLAENHGLTLYDALYAGVARRRGAALATLDSELLRAGLGERPSELVTRLGI